MSRQVLERAGPTGHAGVTEANGKPVGRGMALWISDDTERLPLRLQTELAVESLNVVVREAK